MKSIPEYMKKHVFFEKRGFTLLKGDCLEILPKIKKPVDMIFADPPYNLSNGGISCRAGKMVSVNKGKWDKSKGFEKDYEFTHAWIKACRDVLAPNGTIWISGTLHNIYQVGHALQSQGFHVLNEISWFKPNAPPNLGCRNFTHSHETIIWAKKDKKARHIFNYKKMKEWGNGKINDANKQMRSIWYIPLTPKSEKTNGKHPTQKPEELMRRIIASSTNKGDLVLDPFNGSGTTGVIAKKLGRKFIGIEKEKKYLEVAKKRIRNFV
ncbi:MAG: DNA-methyltransferase [Promethearchaeota archaeon]